MTYTKERLWEILRDIDKSIRLESLLDKFKKEAAQMAEDRYHTISEWRDEWGTFEDGYVYKSRTECKVCFLPIEIDAEKGRIVEAWGEATDSCCTTLLG